MIASTQNQCLPIESIEEKYQFDIVFLKYCQHQIISFYMSLINWCKLAYGIWSRRSLSVSRHKHDVTE